MRDDYKKFMTRIATYLARDSGKNINPAVLSQRIKRFVNDAFEIEVNVARVSGYKTNDDYILSNRGWGNEVSRCQQTQHFLNLHVQHVNTHKCTLTKLISTFIVTLTLTHKHPRTNT